MAHAIQESRDIAARIAAISRWKGDDDPRLPELRRDLKVAQLAESYRRVAEGAPPPTDEQRARLAALIQPETQAA